VFHELIQTINEVTGNRTHRFLNGPQPDMVLTDEVFNSSGTPTDILWLLQDHQNSVTDVGTMSSTSGQATHRNHLEYNAFGQITSQTNSAYAPLQTYTGQILDTTTGLLYYDARWYDPKLGRFVSEDPIGFSAGDANLTRYVGNSWPNGVDPRGLQFDTIGGGRQADAARIEAQRRRDEFRGNVTRMKQSLELIALRARRMQELIAADVAQQGCPSEETIREVWRMAEQMASLTEEYIRSRDRAESLAAAHYGDGVTDEQLQEYFGLPPLPQGLSHLDPGSPSRDAFDERIGREREERDDEYTTFSRVNTGVQIAGLATGLSGIAVNAGRQATLKAGAALAARQLAAVGAGAAVGYGIGQGLDAACDLVDADEVTRAWVSAGFDLAAAIVLKRRGHKQHSRQRREIGANYQGRFEA